MNCKQRNICKVFYDREVSNKRVSFNKIACEKLEVRRDLLYRKDLYAHYGCVNAIEFSNNGQLLISAGDDRRVLLWNTQKALHNFEKPVAMKEEHSSNIFCVTFDNCTTKIYSAGNDDMLLLHDIQTSKLVDVFKHEQPVYGVSMDPTNDYVFATAGDDGRILIFDSRSESDPVQLAESNSPFHSVMYNPLESRLIATGNAKEGTALWDIRISNRQLMRYGGRGENCMNVRWDQNGSRILALRRRQPPILYPLDRPTCIAQFYHNSYYNSCTMKTCCFAGLNDEYVLSGSDDFNVYMWKVPNADNLDNYKVEGTCNILRGHRSIVNQVRFHPEGCMIATSGVEKVVKLWSPLPLPYSSKETKDWVRRRYTHDEYISLLLSSGQFMSHDYSAESVDEDPQMMAFFDSLVQREREGSGTDESSLSDEYQSLNLSADSATSFIDTDFSGMFDVDSVNGDANNNDEVVNSDNNNDSGGNEKKYTNNNKRRRNNNNNKYHKRVKKNLSLDVKNVEKLKVKPKHLLTDYSDTDSLSDSSTSSSTSSLSSSSSSSPSSSSSSSSDYDGLCSYAESNSIQKRKRNCKNVLSHYFNGRRKYIHPAKSLDKKIIAECRDYRYNKEHPDNRNSNDNINGKTNKENKKAAENKDDNNSLIMYNAFASSLSSPSYGNGSSSVQETSTSSLSTEVTIDSGIGVDDIESEKPCFINFKRNHKRIYRTHRHTSDISSDSS